MGKIRHARTITPLRSRLLVLYITHIYILFFADVVAIFRFPIYLLYFLKTKTQKMGILKRQ